MTGNSLVEYWQDVSAKFQSPLESKFFCAFRYGLLREHFAEDGTVKLSITPQHRVAIYSLDFLCTLTDGERLSQVGVELDGHDFHEKTREQAKHDKSRDRAILREGISVVRFTGSEIHTDSDGCAREVFETLKGML